MYQVEDFDVLRRRLTEREALVAASVLPHLPDGECLVRVHDVDPPRRYERPADTRKFKERAPTTPSNAGPCSPLELIGVSPTHF